MSGNTRKVYVIGHKNPDTDSICSAIAYAELKRAVTGNEYSARRAGQINEETQYVLDRFGVQPPTLLQNVKLQVKDIDIHEIDGVLPGTSIRQTWEKMKRENNKTTPVLADGELVGIVSTGDIVRSYMDVYDSRILSDAKTQYRNIIETLDGTLVAGNENGYFTRGKVTIAASSSALMEEVIEKDDLVILSNRYEAQECAIDIDASCLVICNGVEISDELVKKAEEQSIVIISTPYDTFTVSRLINQSIPVSHFMTKGPLLTFTMTDYVDDIKEEMTKRKFRDFPILDRDGQFRGFISRRRLMNAVKKQVILVDHNEKSQAVEGIEEADIVEIIDHHRLGSIETAGPVFFRNQPVGCTATIIAQMYDEAAVEIRPEIAGLLCAAIISDTLLFRSPTCTTMDENTARRLGEIAGADIDELAVEMFNAGSSLKGKSANEICFQDFKQFTINDVTFGVGQISSMIGDELSAAKEELTGYLPTVLRSNGLHMVYFMLTDILDESTELLCCGEDARKYVAEAYDVSPEKGDIILKGVVSRKKQLIPALAGVMQL
ncbi:MAG: putative manganese-dependent inorganic diphosphatase [Lentihominibacter sp.]